MHNRLREFRKVVFASDAAMARALGMAPSNLRKYLNGEFHPGAVLLDKLYRLGLNINWLLTGEGPMFADTYHGFKLTKEYGMESEGSLEYWRQEAKKKEEEVAKLTAALEEFESRDPLSAFDKNRIKNLQKMAQLGKMTIADINELVAILASQVGKAKSKKGSES